MPTSRVTRSSASLPTLSVVIVWPESEGQRLLDAVQLLADPCRHAGAELIVATSSDAAAGMIRGIAPACRVVCGLQASNASLRSEAAIAANGDVVLFVDAIESEQTRRVVDRLEARRISVVSAPRRSEPETRRGARATAASVIVPAHNGAKVLPQTLGALRDSDLPADRWELIVVDDASRDDTAPLAAQYADVLVRIPLRAHGPAYARNRGFEISVGAWAVFLDADVRVQRDTLRRFETAFAQAPTVGAIVGCYDVATPARGIVSQYRNLMHFYAHHETAGDVETFWAPCGAVRREVFAQAGMYDEWHYERPMIEDIELGQRMRALGHRIVVIPEIQGTHLKTWSLLSAIICDLRDHAVPWMRLLMRQRDLRTDRISLRAIERINRIGTWVALMALLIGSIFGDPRWVMTMVVALMPVVVANRRLYAFFWRERGTAFTLAAIPLHLLYYVLLGAAIIIAGALHLLVGEPRPAPIVQAYAEMGFDTWPPVPNRRDPIATLPAFSARG
jgi:glycosyltransferase involved in cell wall biosynthesis